MVEEMGVYMTAPTTNGDSPLPKRAGARSMVRTTWIDRTIRLEYVGAAGDARETTATFLDWTPVGILVSTAGAKCLIAWERLVLAELARLQRRFEELADKVLSGEVERGLGAVACQLLNGARACIRDGLAAREQEELESRLEELERALETRRESRWGYGRR
jgi:hypothetical protein